MAKTLGLLLLSSFSCLVLPATLPGLARQGGTAEGTRSRERVYYVGIVEDTWDYAPSGKNLLNGRNIADDK